MRPWSARASLAMSYAMHKQVHPPTGVDHACAAYFTHPIGDGGPPNLIVTQANHLTVFAIRRESSTATDAQLGARAVAQAKQTANADASVGADVEVSLEVVAEFDLQGTVGSLCALRRRFGAPRNQRDALCIAVRENKLSVVEFDPATQSLVNSSLHSWETPTGLGGVPSAHRVAPLPPLAVADPEGRCAAVLLRGEGGSRLALLPAVEGESFGGEELVDVDEELDEADDAGEGVFSHKNNPRGGGDVRARGTAASVKDSYVLDLAREMKISGVRDAAFLHGYGEPTILVLHEKKPTWAGRLALVNDTCVLSAITLDLDNKRHAVIWRRDRLPHSSYRLCAMPEPLGGALVLSQNFIMHESQESSRALALNPLAGGDAGDESARNAARAAAEAAALATTAGNAAAQDPSLANPPAALASREGTESALGVSVELDAAHAAVVSERRVLLTTKAGALMLLSLRVEGRRLARHGAMHLRRAGGAVLSSGMCLLTRRLLFLGSRVGDSLLVSMQEKDVAATQALPAAPSLKGESAPAEPAAGKKRKAGEEAPAPAEGAPSSKPAGDDDDELEAMLYGEGEGGGAGVAAESGAGDDGFGGDVAADGVGSVGAAALRAAAALANARARDEPGYAFSVRDSVLGISPVIDLTVGASASVRGDVEQRAELVAACGHGKNGALAVLQRGIQPELVTEVEAGTLPGLRGTWTVYRASDVSSQTSSSSSPPFHSYLVIALASSTMVLETGEELKEVSEQVEMVTDTRTVCCGNVFASSLTRIVQVHPKGVRVLDGAKMTQAFSTNDLAPSSDPSDDAEIVAASVCDPYVFVVMSDGSLAVLKGDETNGVFLSLSNETIAKLPRGADVTAACLVDDGVPTADHPGLDKRAPGFLRRGCDSPIVETDAERDEKSERSTSMLALARVGGSVELYALPSCDKIWAADGLSEGVAVLAPVGSRAARENQRRSAAIEGSATLSASTASLETSPPPEIVEMRVDAFERAHERPLLTAIRGDGSVLAYRAFLCPPGAGGVKRGAGRSQLRFARVPLDVEGGLDGGSGSSVSSSGTAGTASRLTRFEGIGDRGGIRGVFVSGARPLWLVARRSRVLALPMRGEALANRAVSFSCFHNRNCEHGFILGTAAGGARICQIPSKMHYEAAWPVRKLALKCTPHHVRYLPDFKLYALSTSTLTKWREPKVEEDDSHFATLVNTRRAKAMARGGVEEQFAIRLLVPGTLESAWQHTLDPGEHVQTISNVQLRNTRTGALQSLLVAGTAFPGGEDTPCRGRALLFDVAWRMRSSGLGSHTGGTPEWIGRLACVREAKMACTALSGLEGNLVVAIGNKLIVHSWDGESLTPVAFFDTPLHTVTVNVVKNFILLGDLQKGAFFLRWKDTGHEKLLTQLAKDFEHMDVAATEFLVDGSALSMLAADTTGNCFSFSYDPKSTESWKGQKLLTKASFHVGSPVNRMVRYKLRAPVRAPNAPPPSAAEQKRVANRHAVFHGTLDGSLGVLAPTDKETHEKLQKLQRCLTSAALNSPAGLNSRSFRHVKTFEGRETRAPAAHEILDGDVLASFERMPWRTQQTLAAAAGMRRDEALELFRKISESAEFV